VNATHAAVSNDALLFVGNSYTYQSVGYDGTNVDRYFSDSEVSPFEAIVMAATNNHTMGVGSFLNATGSQNIAVGGQHLSQHNGIDALDPGVDVILSDNSFEILNPVAAAGRVWDVMVLQDYSTTPGRSIAFTSSYSSTEFNNFFVQGITPIANQLQSYGQTTTKIVLYETWARESVTAAGFPNNWPTRQDMYEKTSLAYSRAKDLLTFDTNQEAVVDGNGTSYFGLDLPNEVVIAPVGTAIENLIADSQTSPVYAQLVLDGKATANIFDILFDNSGGGSPDTSSHLQLPGEFLAAAVLFETIYGVSVADLIDNGQLTQADLTNVWSQNGTTTGPTGQMTLDLDLARYLAGISQMTTNVPEPSSLMLLLAGGIALAGRRRR